MAELNIPKCVDNRLKNKQLESSTKILKTTSSTITKDKKIYSNIKKVKSAKSANKSLKRVMTASSILVAAAALFIGAAHYKADKELDNYAKNLPQSIVSQVDKDLKNCNYSNSIFSFDYEVARAEAYAGVSNGISEETIAQSLNYYRHKDGDKYKLWSESVKGLEKDLDINNNISDIGIVTNYLVNGYKK